MALLKLYITLASGHNNPAVSMPFWKYGKTGFYATQFDDGAIDGIDACISYYEANNFTYTDGCGNAKFYSGEMAVNGGFQLPNYPTTADMLRIISKGWDMANHGDQHGGDGLANPLTDITDLETRLYNIIPYKFNGIVVPTNYPGYMSGGKSVGYAYATSANEETFDGLPVIRGTIPSALYSPLPEFLSIPRDFMDDWDTQASVNYLKGEVPKLFTGQFNYKITGTHSYLDTQALKNGYFDLMTYVKSQSADRLLVCSTREALEYRQMRACPISQSLSGNVLTVTIDTANLPERNRWRDVSLNLTGGTVASVAIDGFTSSSFNAATGLVNGFSQKTDWSTTVPPTPATKFKVSRRFRIG